MGSPWSDGYTALVDLSLKGKPFELLKENQQLGRRYDEDIMSAAICFIVAQTCWTIERG